MLFYFLWQTPFYNFWRTTSINKQRKYPRNFLSSYNIFFSFALFDFSLLCALFITISMARVHFIFQFSLVNEATTRMNAEKKMYFLFHFLCERFHFRFEKRKKNETRESRNRKNFFRFVDSLLTRSKFALVDVECENQRF